ncbi:MAG: right-handed parallel beta-helix repeat-containing protein [Sedimentisphaerales bacterium]|nr:right-handed parallel beta-helix repeat-containing protein [Sedimentisphaerales bacterium]
MALRLKFALLLIISAAAVGSDAENQLFVPSLDYPTIQSAIDDASAGDEVIVAEGTYLENINFLGKAITVRSSEPNDPNVVQNTIIDGSAPDDPNFGSVVIFGSGEGQNSILEGFTITGGTGSWIAVSWEFKGLLWNRCGGGVLCYNMSAPTVRKNVFQDNLAGQGGGYYIYGDPVNPADPSDPSVHLSPIIAKNTFTDNIAIVGHGFLPPNEDYPATDHGDGGGVVAFQGVDAVITDNTFNHNYAYAYGGGLHLRQWSDGVIENNLISDNYSAVGAGIHATYSSAPTIRGNTIQLNTANTGGGGLYIYFQSDPVIEGNLITQNTAQNASGIAVFWDSTPVIRNNLMVNNNGYVIKVEGNTTAVMIVHNTISDNSAAGIVCEWNAVPVIEHNIISGNGIGDANGYGIYVHENAFPLVRYNNVWGNGAGEYGPTFPDQTGVNGNISVPPGFVNSGVDYHLNYDSECINAGDPNFTGGALIDYDGESREMGQFIDIGADEAWPVWNLSSGQGYLSIQAAIDGAGYHDGIKVTPGRYLENIRFNGKVVSLESVDPDNWDMVEKTIIDGNQLDSTIVIYDGEDPNTELAGFTITGGNGISYGGGVLVGRGATPVIRRNIIRDNYSDVKGGGLYYHATVEMSVLEDNIISNNVSGREGGGVHCDTSSSVLIINNVISGNYTVSNGGGVFIFDKRESPSNYLLGNLIIGNESGLSSGGVGSINSVCTLVNNTIVGNKAPYRAGIGTSNLSEHIIANNLIAHNVQGGGISFLGEPNSSIVTFVHNNVYNNEPNDYCGGADWTGVNGNISVDPHFVDEGYWFDAGTPADPNDDFYVPGNYHILPDSPCVDAGEPNAIPSELIRDMDEEERIFGDSVDIGIDEVITKPSDFDTDGVVDIRDLSILCEEWLSEGNDLRSDLYEDGIINLKDFALLADDWLWTGGWYD